MIPVQLHRRLCRLASELVQLLDDAYPISERRCSCTAAPGAYWSDGAAAPRLIQAYPSAGAAAPRLIQASRKGGAAAPRRLHSIGAPVQLHRGSCKPLGAPVQLHQVPDTE